MQVALVNGRLLGIRTLRREGVCGAAASTTLVVTRTTRGRADARRGRGGKMLCEGF